ncbi:MAG: matrixin family metalloprotease [Acidobacteriota bacterium]|nr:matrixin family metalloprotease [Acidobacteriota bacterium]
MSSLRNLFLIAIVVVLVAAPAFGATRLTYYNNGVLIPVAWPDTSFPIRYAIDRRVAQAIPQAAAMLDRAGKDWSAIPDTSLGFQSLGIVDGATAGKDGRNTVSMADDLFADQKFIALTTNWYDDNGRIIEADMQIDPMAVSGGYNVQQLVEHEMGHVLGLDHSAVLSSVMYPYVGTGSSAGLDSDDRVAISTAYAKVKPAAGATLEGRVYGDDGGIFAAQVVAVNDRGEPVATALSDKSGNFMLQGIPSGTYRIYAEPLDGPVNVQNLSGFWQTAKVTSFPTQFAGGGELRVENGRIYGNINVNGSGSVRLNPKWIGAWAAGSDNVSLQAMPAMLHAGTTITLGVGGDGFTSAMTTFDVPNPGFHRISDFKWAGNYVSATFQIDPSTPAGSLVVMVKSGNETAALTGALRIEPSTRTRGVKKL